MRGNLHNSNSIIKTLNLLWTNTTMVPENMGTPVITHCLFQAHYCPQWQRPQRGTNYKRWCFTRGHLPNVHREDCRLLWTQQHPHRRVCILHNTIHRYAKKKFSVHHCNFYFLGLTFIDCPWQLLIFEALEVFTLHVMWVTAVLYLRHLIPRKFMVTGQALPVIAHFCLGKLLVLFVQSPYIRIRVIIFTCTTTYHLGVVWQDDSTRENQSDHTVPELDIYQVLLCREGHRCSVWSNGLPESI